MLFLDDNHSETGPAGYTEKRFSYLNRCGRAECFRVREVLEDWFTRYPENEKDELRSRFQSGDDTHFVSSFFELYLHELLVRLNYRVEVHPEVSEPKSKKPDFLAITPGGKGLFVEAVIASDTTEEETATSSMKNVLYDTINTLKDPDFYVGIKEEGKLKTPPPGRKIRNGLERWLRELDPDKCLLLTQQGKFDDLPKWNFSHDGWKIEFTAYPKSKEARGKPGRRLIGMHMSSGFQLIDSRTSIRQAIRRKASRYGSLEKPYIIAVNAMGGFVDQIDIMEALFGKEVLVFPQGLPPNVQPETKLTRQPDGAWTSTFGPRNTRVSGVLVGVSAVPSSIAAKDLELYHNPWAQHPCEGPITELTEYVPIENRITKEVGKHPRALFDLPETWPF